MGQQVTQFIMAGGIDLEAPYLSLKPGALIDSLNYEVRPFGGYRRIEGYTLYDGRTTGMAAPAGSGPIRGVWVYQGVGYCFRDNVGATAGQMYKATSGGWALQSLGSYLKFDAGVAEFTEGATVTGLTSGATATIRRIAYNSGVFASSSVTGLLVLTNVVGTFQDNEALQIGGVTKATADGTLTAATLPPGGSYFFWNYNFLANASGQRMYGANGVGPAFEWDGTYFCPILQQVGANHPARIVGHAEHLFLGFTADGILRISSIGEPREYISTTGASDVGAGDEIRDLRPLVGGVLAVGCAGSMQLIYGSSAADWERKRFDDYGVRTRSMREIGGTMVFMSARGVQRMDQSQAFGDFQSTSISVPINKRLLPVVQLIDSATAVVSRNKDQYRVFFGKGGYYFTFRGGKMVGIMPVAFKHEVSVACEGEESNGKEIILFGDASGNVFRMDNSAYKFNGENIGASLVLEFLNEGRPTQRKHYRKATFYIELEGATPQIQARAAFDFGDGRVPASPFSNIVLPGSAGEEWDEGLWDEFEWAGDEASEASIKFDGTGQNMGLIIYATGAEEGTHTFESGVLHWTPRRLMR